MQRESLKNTGPMLDGIETFAPSLPGQLTNGELMSSAADSLAKTSAWPEMAQACPESEAGCSLRLSASFAFYDRDSSSWRTSQRCLLGEWATFSGRWPKSGLMLNGMCYRRRNLARRISGNASLFLPTIGKNEFKGAGKDRFRGSKNFRGAKMSEGLRTCASDPIYLHPCFAELAMGFPIGWTDLAAAEIQSSPLLPNGSDAASLPPKNKAIPSDESSK